MIAKSLIIFSLLFSSIGMSGAATRFDNALLRLEYGNINSAEAEFQTPKLPELEKRLTVQKTAPSFAINAKNAILVEANTNSVIFKQNPYQSVPIASTTKIMTAYVALQNYQLSEIITISKTASEQIGADTFLIPGEKITVSELLHCLLIKSGNDAAYALAEHMSKNNNEIKTFMNKMNNTALELGMKNTRYKDPAGLDVTGYSSAYDLYLVTKQALKNDTFRTIVGKKEYTATDIDNSHYHALKNSNRLITDYDYIGAIGVKTGYMPEAGHCLVSAAQRDGMLLIGVVLNTHSDTATASAIESVRMLDWGFKYSNWEI